MPSADQGLLTKTRAAFVRNENLSACCSESGIKDYILCDPLRLDKERKILGDVFEALIGAIFIDQGFQFDESNSQPVDVHGSFLHRFLFGKTPLVDEEKHAKVILQQVTQKHYGTLPSYVVGSVLFAG